MSKQRSPSDFEFGILIIRICSEFSLPYAGRDLEFRNY
jgi:hypothetical protein